MGKTIDKENIKDANKSTVFRRNTAGTGTAVSRPHKKRRRLRGSIQVHSLRSPLKSSSSQGQPQKERMASQR